MKTRILIGLIVVVFGFVGRVSAAFIITFDELGTGSVLNTDTGSLGFLAANPMVMEPNSGLLTLRYVLPFTVTTGDVLVCEPNCPPNPTANYPANFSDVLRFIGNQLFVFSDLPEPGSPRADPADVGLPPSFLANNSVGIEVGGEGANGLTFIPMQREPPLQPQPGFLGVGANAVEYRFISDTPEPSTLLLAGTGLAGVCVRALRRRKRNR